MKLWSNVKGHKGWCKPCWLNKNQVLLLLDGGVTGFFRSTKEVRWWPVPIKTGEPFHGIIRGNQVYATGLEDY